MLMLGDWRYVHVCLLGKRIFHGRLPWKQPNRLMMYASEMTGIPEDDLVHLYYVRHGPEDLRGSQNGTTHCACVF